MTSTLRQQYCFHTGRQDDNSRRQQLPHNAMHSVSDDVLDGNLVHSCLRPLADDHQHVQRASADAATRTGHSHSLNTNVCSHAHLLSLRMVSCRLYIRHSGQTNRLHVRLVIYSTEHSDGHPARPSKHTTRPLPCDVCITTA